ncbi:MAG: efflux RND transporter periplasmic adaptor subunit [Clostridia bacterium]|nr:efflux RND transporter periplasmic adaptor subunit [Clostridia bacterium]
MENQPKEKKKRSIKGILEKWKAFSGKKKVLIVSLLLILIVVLNMWIGSFGGNDDALINVKAGVVKTMDLRQEVSIKGTVSGTDSANVYSSAPYRILQIRVQEGDTVTEGQILAELDAATARSQYNQAAIAAADAKRNYDTATALYAEGAISKADFLSAQSGYQTAALVLQSYSIEESSNVTSPIAGTVTRVNTSVGKLANGSSSEALFVIENLENLQMKVDISEYDISKIKIGQTVEISAEVLGQEKVEGIVLAISPTGEVKGPGSSEMVIPIVIQIDKGKTNLIAGVTATAVILTNIAENAMTVPIDAIIEDVISGETSVFSVKEGKLTKKVIQILLEGNFDVAVAGDLVDGEIVVLAPTFDMTDGMTVTVE